MATASITYSVTTPESAENGEHAEHGWWLPGGWEHPLEDADGYHESVLEEAKAGDFDLSVEDAVEAAISLGAVHEIQVDGTYLSARSVDAPLDRANIEDGESRYYTLHVEDASPEELQSIKDRLSR